MNEPNGKDPETERPVEASRRWHRAKVEALKARKRRQVDTTDPPEHPWLQKVRELKAPPGDEADESASSHVNPPSRSGPVLAITALACVGIVWLIVAATATRPPRVSDTALPQVELWYAAAGEEEALLLTAAREIGQALGVEVQPRAWHSTVLDVTEGRPDVVVTDDTTARRMTALGLLPLPTLRGTTSFMPFSQAGRWQSSFGAAPTRYAGDPSLAQAFTEALATALRDGHTGIPDLR